MLKKKGMNEIVFIILTALLLTIITVPVPLSGVLADDPGSPAPLNPAFVEFQSNQRNMQRSLKENGQEDCYGYVPSPVDLSHIESLRKRDNSDLRSAAGYGLPDAFNWLTPTNRVTSVKNQSTCGTCWCFGNTSVMESRVWIQGLAADQNYSEQALDCCLDSCWTSMAADRCNSGGNVGGNDMKAQDTFIKIGAKLDTCQPYDTNTINSQGCLSCTPTYVTTNFVRVATTDTTGAARDAIKTAIQTYGPVTVSYYTTCSSCGLYTNSGDGYGYKFYDTSTHNADHTITIVGWDDGVPHPAGGGAGAWLAKNSWGTGVLNNGYFWMCYGKANATDFGSLRAVKAYDSHEKLYYLDESGWTGNYGWNETNGTAWGANKFTATQAGSLTHVDFATPGVSTIYDIRVYKSGDINNLGTAVATQTGTCGDAPGYYSILLSTPVALSNGQDFIVAVKMTTNGYGYPIPVESDFTGCTPPIQTARSYVRHYDTGTWYDLANQGFNACIRARVAQSGNNGHAFGDYNGDSKSDYSVWRPNGGNWFIYPSFNATQFGLNSDVPVPGDYNADSTTERAIYRPNGGNWFIYPSFTPTQFGLNGDIPVPGDYNNDSTTERAIYRPSTGNWYVYPSFTPTQFGLNGDVPVPGCYTTAGKTDYAVWRPSTGNWYVYPSFTPTQFGLNGDIPVPADYNGDGKDEFAIWRPSTGNWYVYPSFTPTQFGLNGDIPVPADYNGDGKAEFAIWRPSTGNWYVYPSFTPTQFGINGDMPGTMITSVRYLKFGE